MTFWQNYHIAQTIPDALEALEKSANGSHLIAGGTDLLLDLQQGRIAPAETLVDISQIPEMRIIEERDEGIFIGAAVPLNRVIASSNLQSHTEALIDAANLIGGPQVRNVATLGGNICHALPAADGTIALLALDARAEIADQSGRKIVTIEKLFHGPGKTALDPHHEILVGFYVSPRKANQGSAFCRVMRPQGVAIAILNAAVWIERDGFTIRNIRISCGPAGPVPFRARSTENELCRHTFDPTTIQNGVEALIEEATFRTSPHRATAEYRRHIAGVLFRKTIETAWNRAGMNTGITHD